MFFSGKKYDYVLKTGPRSCKRERMFYKFRKACETQVYMKNRYFWCLLVDIRSILIFSVNIEVFPENLFTLITFCP